MSDLEIFRKQKDEFFRTHPRSPLTEEQRRSFGGLRYYPEVAELALRLPLEPAEGKAEVRMQTTTGGEQVYRRAGTIRFEVEGREATLTLYASEHPGLFLPFRDATSGNETYGGGRYLDLEPADAEGRVEVDFNLGYNPFCAYNEAWTCPLPPPENWLEVPIRAGERSFTP